MLGNLTEASGGLGVLVRVPGLVKSPSLVNSAVVPLLLLHVEMQESPRLGLLSGRSSTGELAFDVDLSALVKRDSFRSQTGFDLAKDVVEEWRSCRGAGRGVRPSSGGSSRSAMASSSEVMAGGDVLEMFVWVPNANAPLLLM